MQNRINEAIAELQAFVTRLDHEVEKESTLLDLVHCFPYLHGYWSQIIDEIPNMAASDIYESCPSLDMFTIILNRFQLDTDYLLEIIANKVGYHYYAADIIEACFKKTGNKQLLKVAVDLPLHGYARIYQLAYENKVIDEATLNQKCLQVSKDVDSIWKFESKLNRDFFHVIEVDTNELQIWKQYLLFTEKLGDFNRTYNLYQRCLIVTALYPEFWLMWIRWLCKENSQLDVKIMRQALHFHPNNQILLLIFAIYTKEPSYNHLLSFDDAAIVDPILLFSQWQDGKCPDPFKYAQKLLDAGHLKEFFEVDRTLIY